MILIYYCLGETILKRVTPWFLDQTLCCDTNTLLSRRDYSEERHTLISRSNPCCDTNVLLSRRDYSKEGHTLDFRWEMRKFLWKLFLFTALHTDIYTSEMIIFCNIFKHWDFRLRLSLSIMGSLIRISLLSVLLAFFMIFEV